LFKEENLLD